MDKTGTRASPDDPEVLSVDLKKLSDGVYGVDWGVTSKDGHVIDGALGFTVDGADAKREGPVEPAAKNAPIGLGVVEIAALFGVLVLVVLALRWLVSRFSSR